MDLQRLKELLEGVREGGVSVDEGLKRLAGFPALDLGHTRLDTQRELRCGFPEVVYGEGKTPTQLVDISRTIVEEHGRLLVTRVGEEAAAAVQAAVPEAGYRERARALTVGLPDEEAGEGYVLVLSAGTADEPPAEEAAITARMLGARVRRLADVGVAGLHRLLEHAEELREARVVVVVAGMEGALPSVVGGLVDRPVIAVPTSVGYGASFGGVAALLAMLNTCAAGVTVVNIDNGFGAGYSAALINSETPDCDEGGSNVSRQASLAVENGLVLRGRSVGATGERAGDLVFNTAMSGYHEILTDPSYAGQVVLMTYPLIGNYGVANEDAESRAAWPEAFVVREMASRHSSHRADSSLPDWLREAGVVAIEGVDTRRLTKLVRTAGSLRCVISTEDHDADSLVAKARGAQATDGRDLASVVSCQEPYAWSEGYDASYPALTGPSRDDARRIVAYDFGIKRNILRSLVHCGLRR